MITDMNTMTMKELGITKFEVILTTKKDKNAAEVETTLTLEVGHLTVAEFAGFAVSDMRVKVQDIWRRADGPIPKECTYKVDPKGTKAASTGKNYWNALLLVVRKDEARANRLVERYGSARAACEAIEQLLG